MVESVAFTPDGFLASQVLVFVHSRKETAKTARFCKEQAIANDVLARFMRDDSASREILQTEAEAVKDNDLKVRATPPLEHAPPLFSFLGCQSWIRTRVTTSALPCLASYLVCCELVPAALLVLDGTRVRRAAEGCFSFTCLVPCLFFASASAAVVAAGSRRLTTVSACLSLVWLYSFGWNETQNLNLFVCLKVIIVGWLATIAGPSPVMA